MRKIAFLMQESIMAGVEYNAVQVAEAIDKDRFHITFLCPKEGKLTNYLKQRGIPWIVYRRGRLLPTSTKVSDGYIFNPIASFYDLLVFIKLSFSLAPLLKENKFDLVVTNGLLANLYGSLASHLVRVPCVWEMHDVVSKTKAFGLMSWTLNNWARAFASQIIASSEGSRNQFSATVRRRIALIPNGIDMDKFRPDFDPTPVRTEWGIKSNEILVGHIGRFTSWKGQLDFIRAAHEVAQQIQNVKFVLVGAPVFDDDAYEREIKRLTEDLKLTDRVIFPGFRDDIQAVLAAMDIFVHSSIKAEGCPMTLITAMAMGKPVVATNITGNNEVITDSNQGILVEANNPRAIAEALLRLIKNPERAQSLGKRARAHVLESYSINIHIKSYEKILEMICA